MRSVWQWSAAILAASVALFLLTERRDRRYVPTEPASPRDHARRRFHFSDVSDFVASETLLSGSVRDGAGMPIASAQVCATCASCEAATTDHRLCTETDQDGRFAFRDLVTTAYTLTGTAFDYAPATVGPISITAEHAESDVVLVLRERGEQLSGIVLDAVGGAIPGAKVLAIHQDSAALAASSWGTVADENGRFRLPSPRGLLTLSASADGYASSRIMKLSPAEHVEIVLVPGGAIRGVVLSARDGRPIADAEVRAYAHGAPRLASHPAVRSDDDGSFLIPHLDQGQYAVEASGVNYRGAAQRSVTVGLGDRVSGVEVRVEEAASVRGRVVDDVTGEPCPAGMVRLGPPLPWGNPYASEAARVAAAEVTQLGERPVGAYFGPIGEDGTVAIDGVPSGRYFVSVTCGEAKLRRGPDLLTLGAQAISDLEWRVARGIGLSILVLDDQGRPLPGAQIVVASPPRIEGGPTPLTVVTADAEGRHESPRDYAPGRYHISPYGGALADPVQVELREGRERAQATLRLRGSAALDVQVRSNAGDTLDGLYVQAVRLDAEAAERADLAPAVTAVPSGAGHYRIRPLEPGRYRVVVNDGINPSADVAEGPDNVFVVTGGEALHASIRLPREGRIQGTVVDESGQPVPNALVRLARQTDDFRVRQAAAMRQALGERTIMTDLDGQFSAEGLAPGATFLVQASQPGSGSARAQAVADGNAVALTLQTAAPSLSTETATEP